MTVNFNVGDKVITNQPYIKQTLTSLNCCTKATLNILGYVRNTVCDIVDTGYIGTISYVKLRPNEPIALSQDRIAYFCSDDHLNNSFELSEAYIPDTSFIECLNNTGITLNAGVAVRQTGFDATTQLPTIALASSSSLATAKVLGVTAAEILDGESGSVIQEGSIVADTSLFSAVGDNVFLGIDGAFAVSPTSDTILSIVGTVLTLGLEGSINVIPTLNAKIQSYIAFDAENGVPPHQEGLVYYNSHDKALTVYNDISDTSLQIGQESIVRVMNDTDDTIYNGDVVYISGSSGNRPTIALAQANNAATSCVCGMATHDILKNQEGLITTFGVVRDIDTIDFPEGSIIYLSAADAGKFVKTIPNAPNYGVRVGIVLNEHAEQGSILINPFRTSSLEELSDVNGATPAGGEILYYLPAGYWEVTSGLSIDSTHATFSLLPVMPSCTVAEALVLTPTAGAIIYVTNESGGPILAFGDGTNWRRVTDRAVIS